MFDTGPMLRLGHAIVGDTHVHEVHAGSVAICGKGDGNEFIEGQLAPLVVTDVGVPVEGHDDIKSAILGYVSWRNRHRGAPEIKKREKHKMSFATGH